MKRRIVFATGNENKMKEIRMILSDLNTEIVSMKEAGVDIDIVEDGMSFEENAEIKARSVARILTILFLRMTPGSKSIISIKLREFILQDLQEKTHPMILKTVFFWIVWKGFRMKSVLRDSYVRSRLYFLTEA